MFVTDSDLDYIFHRIQPQQIPFNFIISAYVVTRSGSHLKMTGMELKNCFEQDSFEGENAVASVKLIINSEKMNKQIYDLSSDLLDLIINPEDDIKDEDEI